MSLSQFIQVFEIPVTFVKTVNTHLQIIKAGNTYLIFKNFNRY